MTAEVPALSPIAPSFQKDPPPVGSPAWMRWFQNGKCGVPFDEGAKSGDFSLQLTIGITNFYTWRQTMDGLFANQYSGGTPPLEKAFATMPPSARVPSPRGKTVFPILRDMPAPAPPKK
jgi:hypothetical protein